jgi:hypothetical protein
MAGSNCPVLKKMKAANADSEARPVLERLIRAFNNARTLHYEGRKIHPNGVGGQADGPVKDKGPVTQQKYYLKNDSGMRRIRVESCAMIRGMSVTSIFISDFRTNQR